MPDNIALLQDAIAHWQRMRDDTLDYDDGPTASDCALCNVYLLKIQRFGSSCHGCPVRDYTGKTGCYGTPYGDAAEAIEDYRQGLISPLQLRVAVQEEIDFLERVLHMVRNQEG